MKRETSMPIFDVVPQEQETLQGFIELINNIAEKTVLNFLMKWLGS